LRLAHLFDHLVGNRKQIGREAKTKQFGSLSVDDEFELGRLNDRQVSRLAPSKNASDVDTGLPVEVRQIDTVARQPTVSHKCAQAKHRRHLVPCHQTGKLDAACDKERIGGYRQCLEALPPDGLESRVNFGICSGVQELKLQVARARRSLQILQLFDGRRKGRVDEDSKFRCLREEIA
jgi:hypothetical protein